MNILKRRLVFLGRRGTNAGCRSQLTVRKGIQAPRTPFQYSTCTSQSRGMGIVVRGMMMLPAIARLPCFITKSHTCVTNISGPKVCTEPRRHLCAPLPTANQSRNRWTHRRRFSISREEACIRVFLRKPCFSFAPFYMTGGNPPRHRSGLVSEDVMSRQNSRHSRIVFSLA